MEIREAIIHQLVKASGTNGEGSVQIQPRALRLPINEFLVGTVQTLLETYSLTVSGYGTLGVDENIHRFPILLNTYVASPAAQARAFIDFSVNSVGLIAEQMKNESFATGGYVIFLRYTNMGDDWLLIVILKLKSAPGVDPVTMDLQQALTLDISKFHEAARVNLTKWATNTQPYLSFVKPKGSRVSDYFRNALACLNFTDSKHHTAQVIQALGDFIGARDDIPADEKANRLTDARQRLYDCFVANPSEVVLATISASVMPADPTAFSDFIRTGPGAENYQINNTFKPDRTTYSKIKRLRGKMGSVTVSFDVEDVRAQRVRYDQASNSLVLTQPSRDLVAEILKYEQPADPDA